MAAARVAIIAPGDMGHAVGARLRAHGARITTCLAGRSPRSARLAHEAGMTAAADDTELVRTADIFLSIVPPAAAVAVAERIATALRGAGATPLYADCNAISPATADAIGRTITSAGARFLDVGIIGSPPQPNTPGPRFYASGEHVTEFLSLREYGLDIRPVGSAIGQASALKMSYAALTKGLAALGGELLIAAKIAGVSEVLAAELRETQPQLLQWLGRQLPNVPPKAYRWVAEMEEIAATFAGRGLPGATLTGAAQFFAFVASSPLGRELPERRERGQTLEDVVQVLAAACVAESRV